MLEYTKPYLSLYFNNLHKFVLLINLILIQLNQSHSITYPKFILIILKWVGGKPNNRKNDRKCNGKVNDRNKMENMSVMRGKGSQKFSRKTEKSKNFGINNYLIIKELHKNVLVFHN